MRAALGQVDHVAGRERSHVAGHAVHLWAGPQQVMLPHAQARGVEALALELGEQGRIEAGQVVVQAAVRQTGREGGVRRAR